MVRIKEKDKLVLRDKYDHCSYPWNEFDPSALDLTHPYPRSRYTIYPHYFHLLLVIMDINLII